MENPTAINPRLIEQDGVAINQGKKQLTDSKATFSLDRDWLKTAFLINDSKLDNVYDAKNRYWNSANAKFTDTRMGCNIGINSKPQYTRYCDIRNKGRLRGRSEVGVEVTTGNHGLGGYYSDAIDNPSQTVYLRFGVPQFNSLSNFLSRAFDPNQTSVARTGRGTSVFYDAAKAAGTLATAMAAPPVAAIMAAGWLYNKVFTRETSKFYTLKPTMHNYWSTVNELVKILAINRGIMPKIIGNDGTQKIGQPFKLDQDHYSMLHDLMPDVFNSENGIDVYAMANKAQRMANQMAIDDFNAMNEGDSTNFLEYVKKEITGDGTHRSYQNTGGRFPTLASWLDNVSKFTYYKSEDSKTRLEMDPRINPDDPEGKEYKDPGILASFGEFFDAEFRQGSQFAVFKVEHTGTASESFGNTSVEPQISQQLNSVSSQIRDARFSFADGNFSDNIVGNMIEGALGAAKDVVTGLISGASLGLADGLLGLAGSGFLDIPKHWQSSSANLNRSSYTLKLISPYNNPISHLQNIYIPLAMLLAGTLPLSCGKQAYTSPFLCQLFDRGRCQIRLGLIESLTLVRGTSNLAFDLKGNALAIDVTFTVADLSSIMHMPVSTGSLTKADMGLDEDNILMDYLAVLAGQDLYTQLYPMAKAKLNFAKLVMSAKKATSPAYWSSMMHESMTGGILSYTPVGWAAFGLESIARGSDIVSQGGLTR